MCPWHCAVGSSSLCACDMNTHTYIHTHSHFHKSESHILTHSSSLHECTHTHIYIYIYLTLSEREHVIILIMIVDVSIVVHFSQNVSHNFPIVILRDVQQLRPAQNVIEVILYIYTHTHHTCFIPLVRSLSLSLSLFPSLVMIFLSSHHILPNQSISLSLSLSVRVFVPGYTQ